jgi:hypothetical protein
MRLTYRPAEKPADSPNHWVGFSFCLEMTECRSAGELGFADSKPRMPRNFISFVEIYGKNTDLSALQNFSVTFSHPRLNGRSVRIESVEAFFPPDIPAIARVMRIDPMTVKIEIGKSDDRGQFRTDKHKNKFQSLP